MTDMLWEEIKTCAQRKDHTNTQAEGDHPQAKERGSEPNSSHTLILDDQLSELLGNKFLLFMVAQEN